MHEIEIFTLNARPLAPELIQRWSRIPTTIASDILAGAGLIDPAIRLLRPPGAQLHVVGLARTVLARPPDFGAVLLGVDATQAGEVLVIAAGGDAQTAMIGEVLCGVSAGDKSTQNRGLESPPNAI